MRQSHRHPIVWLLVGLIAGLLISRAPVSQGQQLDWHMILVTASNETALRDWLARRNIAPRAVGVQLAARLSEADVVALAERDLALLIRAPLPGEFIPEPTAVRQWMPLVLSDAPIP